MIVLGVSPDEIRQFTVGKYIGLQGSSAVLTRASVLRFSHPLWNVSAQNERSVGAPKISVIIATSLKQSGSGKGRTDHAHPYCTYPKKSGADRFSTF